MLPPCLKTMKSLMKRLLLVALFGSMAFIFVTHLTSNNALLKKSISLSNKVFSTPVKNTPKDASDVKITVMANVPMTRGITVSVPSVGLVQRLGELAVAPAKSLIAKTTEVLESWHTQQINRKIRMIKARELDSDAKEILLTTLKAFLSHLRQSQIDYLLYGGSLLGSWRHHGIVPWDDDVDIFLDIRYKRKLLVSLDTMENFTARDAGSRIKFYSHHALQRTRFGWKWPYLDVQFYTGNETHIWDMAREFKSTKYSRNDTFPAHVRPFEGIDVLAPANSLKFLWQYYGQGTMCSTGWYKHMIEKPVTSVSVPCRHLEGVYPFVHRREVNGKIEESLVLGNRTLQKVLVDEPLESITNPYGLNLEKT